MINNKFRTAEQIYYSSDWFDKKKPNNFNPLMGGRMGGFGGINEFMDDGGNE